MNDETTFRRVQFQLRAQGMRQTGNSLRSGIHSRGYLPHIKREGASYFVTFRLADSLPRKVWLQLQNAHAERLRRAGQNAIEREEEHRIFRRQIERYLDGNTGECHLSKPEIADIAAEALQFFHGKQYALEEWVVMPNHVHVVLLPLPNHTLSAILQSRKRHIAREANRLLGRTGEAFWQPESYDHWIRDEEEKARIRRYVRQNPVKAGLCERAEDWKWSSAAFGSNRAGCQPAIRPIDNRRYADNAG